MAENKVPVTYDEFVKKESHEVGVAYKKRTGQSPNESDLAHNSWRRLVELWTHRDVIHSILNEPLEDGGPGGAVMTIAPSPVSTVGVDVSLTDKYFLVNGVPTRLKGFSAFPLLDRIINKTAADWEPWVEEWVSLGYNYCRTWLYTPPAWGEAHWELPSLEDVRRALELLAQTFPLVVEVTLTTDRRNDGYDIVEKYSHGLEDLPYVLLEAINEPGIYDKLDELKVVDYISKKRPWTNGMYGNPKNCRGTYGVAHDARGGEWPRKAKDQLERWRGGGPNDPSDPAYRFPWICDEPGKLEDNGRDMKDWIAYYGVASQMSAGAVVHTIAGKFLSELSPDERTLRATAIQAMKFFPDTTFEPSAYSHDTDDEKLHGCLRTYRMKNTRVRIRPSDNSEILSFV